MSKIIVSLVLASTLAGAAWAQTATLEPNAMPSDSATLSSTNGNALGGAGVSSDTMRRGTNAPAWGRDGTPPGAWQRSTNAPAWKSTGRSSGTLDNPNGGATDTRVDTKAGTDAEPIRGQNTPSGTTPIPGGSSSTLPSTSTTTY